MKSIKIIRDKKRIKKTGEVFTPSKMVDKIISRMPIKFFRNPNTIFIDSCCGEGNIIIQIILKKLEFDHTVDEIIDSIYGCDYMEDNVEICRTRILETLKVQDSEFYRELIKKRIICFDSINNSIYDKFAFTNG